jgi:hypothetical protein
MQAGRNAPNTIEQRLTSIASRTPEEIADRNRVAELIRKARAQNDPGVPSLVSKLEKNGIRLKDVNHITGNPAREVDIETASGTIVQVKKLSSAKDLITQVHETEAATGQRVVGFVVKQHKKADAIVNKASRHIEVTNDYNKLLEMLK